MRCASSTSGSVDYDGISGPITFDEHGDPTEATIGIFQYGDDNKYTRIDEVDPSSDGRAPVFGPGPFCVRAPSGLVPAGQPVRAPAIRSKQCRG